MLIREQVIAALVKPHKISARSGLSPRSVSIAAAVRGRGAGSVKQRVVSSILVSRLLRVPTERTVALGDELNLVVLHIEQL